MAKMITIRRKGYSRRAFTSKRAGKNVHISATKVGPSTFKVRDRGKAGRGQKVVPPLKRGALGGPGFFNRSHDEQEKKVFSRARRIGERKVIGELRALQVFFKRTDPEKSRRALELSKRVAGSFKGQQKVTYPQGFRKKR